MNITTKWRAAAAGVLSIALLATSAGLANAAPGDALNPQSNGSKGSFFLWDANTGEKVDETQTFTLDFALIASSSPTDLMAEINPSATRPVTGATAFTGAWRFISEKTPAARDGGTNTWKTWAVEATAGPNGGTLLPNVALESFGVGTAAVVAAGGSYWYGVAYTINNGVTVVGSVYREINITAGSGNYTVGPVEVEGPAVEKTNTTTTVAASDNSIHTGESVTLTATVAPSAATGNVQFLSGSTSLGSVAVSGGTAILTTTELPQGNNSVTAVYGGDDAHNGSTSPAITVSATPLTGIDSEDLPAVSPNPVSATQQGFSVTVGNLGAYNGQKVNVWGYSEPTLLGQAIVSGDQVTVPIGSLPAGEHTIAVTLNSDDSLIGFTTITLVLTQAGGSPAGIDLTATVRTSVDGAFQLIVPANATATIDNPQLVEDTPGHFTSVSTGTLGQFRVVDDRIITHRGWTLTTDVAPFTSAGKPNIANSALGLDPILVDALTADEYGDTVAPAALDTPVKGATQVAGSATYTSTFAELGAGKFNPQADFNADLAFKAPEGAPAGTYNSTLTLTLVSK